MGLACLRDDPFFFLFWLGRADVMYVSVALSLHAHVIPWFPSSTRCVMCHSVVCTMYDPPPVHRFTYAIGTDGDGLFTGDVGESASAVSRM